MFEIAQIGDYKILWRDKQPQHGQRVSPSVHCIVANLEPFSGGLLWKAYYHLYIEVYVNMRETGMKETELIIPNIYFDHLNIVSHNFSYLKLKEV